MDKPKLSFEQLKKSLNELYAKEDSLVEEIRLKVAEYEQLQEDKELLQMMLMHQANKEDRVKNFNV